MPLFFITGNNAKFEEAQRILPFLQHRHADLTEIQSDSSADVIRAKLEEARKRFGDADEFIVEDISLRMDALRGLPGPLIKWFLRALKSEGLFRIADNARSYRSEAVCMLGYARPGHDPAFIEARVKGTIVKPRGSLGFGWDFIFEPDGATETFAEMSRQRKLACSPRTSALRELAATFPVSQK